MDWFTLALMSAITLAAADALTKKFLPTYRGWELLVIRIGVPALLLLPVMFIYPIPPVPAAFGGIAQTLSGATASKNANELERLFTAVIMKTFRSSYTSVANTPPERIISSVPSKESTG